MNLREFAETVIEWERQGGHDGHHYGPCVDCQIVFEARIALEGGEMMSGWGDAPTHPPITPRGVTIRDDDKHILHPESSHDL